MKVFISHTFAEDDQELAVKLQKILAEENIDGYLAEKTKEYDLLIRDKIRQEIENSDHMIAIVTNKARESASVNQEIGYALREGIKPIIMLEENAKEGVLSHGIEPAEFTRANFEQHCINVRDFILKKGSRKKSSFSNDLREKIYPELYNKMMKIHENADKFKTITSNPWKELEASAKLKVEDDVRQLFDEFTEKLADWNTTLSIENRNFTINQATLGNIVGIAFKRADLIKPDGYIILDSGSSQEPKHWIEAFKFIIFDESIKNEQSLYDKLLNFAKVTSNGHAPYLLHWKQQKPELYSYIFETLPLLRSALRIDFHNEKLQQQQDEMANLVERIVKHLEEKIS